MTEIRHLTAEEETFLHPYLPLSTGRYPDGASAGDVERPFVTLTYACSLDSMIALAPGVRTTLSGPETKSMTHYLRLHHDAILVGVGTAIADDPGLNCRYPGADLESQPRPVVIDRSRRWAVESAKVTQLGTGSKGKAPWVIEHASNAGRLQGLPIGYERLPIGKHSLRSVGDSTMQQASDSDGSISWIAILHALRQRGINSVMIEGGATIINELLSRPDLVDSVIITIAPTFLGQGGTTVTPSAKIEGGHRTNAAHVTQSMWRQFGHDVVLCGRLS